MKKQILFLMLSASILTASPLFAMEDPNEPSEPPHKAAIKQTSPIYDSEKSDKLVERAKTLLEEIKDEIKDDKKTTDTKIRYVRHGSSSNESGLAIAEALGGSGILYL